MAFWLCVVFFLSGASALVFETLWFHQCGLALGNSVWATSLVLAGFMGGLALGNGLMARWGHRVRRPVRVYAVLEVIIGATGLALVYLLPELNPWLAPTLAPFLEQPWLLNPVRLALAFALLLVPSAAMGATLPLLVGALYRRDPRFGRALGQLYGWNTLGAVLGAVAGEALLVDWFGIRASARVAAGMNLAAAVLALRFAGRFDRVPRSDPHAAGTLRWDRRAGCLLAAAFLCGAILLALEVVWFRLVSMFAHGSSLAFAVMLAVVLAGIGAGGLAGSRGLARLPRLHRHLPAIAAASGALSVAVFAGFDLVLRATGGRPVAGALPTLGLSLPLIFPVSFLSGILFTLLGEALHRELRAETRSAGLLTLSNTAGAMLGSLAGGFLLLPQLGVEGSTRLLAAGYAAAAGLMLLGGLRPSRRGELRSALGFGSLLVVAWLGFPSGLMEHRYLRYPLERLAQREGSVPVAFREGLTETILYLRRDLFGEPLYYRLLTNSFSMSSTSLKSLRYMKLFVYWPVAVHPDPKQALLISYGVGGTAKALTDTRSLEAIDVVDTSREILELSHIVYPEPGSHPLEDPRVRVFVEDGRYFLQLTERRYDLITGEPPPPKMAGVVNLYTREYFELVRDRLADGGIVSYWLPVHGLDESDAKAIVRAFCDAFADCSLWSGSGLDWILMGTREAGGPVSLEHFTRQWRDPVVGPELRRLGFERPEQLGALFLAGPEQLHALTRDVSPLDDDHPKRLGNRFVRPAQARRVYTGWLDGEAARRRFARSPLIRRLWPPALRTASLEFFEIQGLIDRHFLTGPRDPALDLPVVHRLLRDASLHTLPLWYLGSNGAAQRAAARARERGQRGPELEWQLGLGALAARDFGRAVDHLGSAEIADRVLATYYRIYALAMAGRPDEARRAARSAGIEASRTPRDRAFWRFVNQAFDLAEPSPPSG